MFKVVLLKINIFIAIMKNIAYNSNNTFFLHQKKDKN